MGTRLLREFTCDCCKIAVVLTEDKSLEDLLTWMYAQPWTHVILEGRWLFICPGCGPRVKKSKEGVSKDEP